MTTMGSSFIGAIASPWLVAGVIAYSTGLLVFAKTQASLPICAPVPVCGGLGFILATFVSWWLFDERLTFNQIGASSLIFTDLVVMIR